MRRTWIGLVWVVIFLGGFTCPTFGQQFVGEIGLDDGDVDDTPDSPFGAILSPDGRFLIVCISGDPDFDELPPELNNHEVRVIDRSTNTVVNAISVGLFPVECAVAVHGSVNYLYVSNSSDGTVSAFAVADGDFDDPGSITELAGSPLSLGAFSFPSGMVVSDDQTLLYVGTAGGAGDVHEIDTDPGSGTFNSILSTFHVDGVHNRLAIHEPWLVVTQGTFTFPFSSGHLTMLDRNNPVDRVELVLTPNLDFNEGLFGTTVDVAIRSNGMAYVTTFGAGTGSHVSVIDVPNRTLVKTINVGSSGSEEQHGIGISPDERYAAVTNFVTHRVVILDLLDDSVDTVLDSPNEHPNEAVWSLDGCTVYVTNQDSDGATLDSVGLISRFDNRAMVLSGTTSPSLSGTVELTLRGGCEGLKGGVLFSSSDDGGVFQGIQVALSNPIQVLEGGFFDSDGVIVPAPIPVPDNPTLIGTATYYQGGAKDPGPTVRLSNVHTVIYQP